MSTRRRLIVQNPGPYGPYGAPAAREAPRQSAVGSPYGGHPGAGYAHDAALLNHNLVSAPIGVPPHLARIAQANAAGMAMRVNHVGTGRVSSHPQVYDQYAPPMGPPSNYYHNSAVHEDWDLDEVAAPGPQFRMTDRQRAAASHAAAQQYERSRGQSNAGHFNASHDIVQNHHSVANAESALADLEAHARPFVQAMAQNVKIMTTHSDGMLSQVVGTLVSLAKQDVKLNSIESHTNRELTSMTNTAYGFAQTNGVAGALWFLSCVGEIARKAVDMQPTDGDMEYVKQRISEPNTGMPNGLSFEMMKQPLLRVQKYVEGQDKDMAYRAMRQTVVDAHLMSLRMSMLVTTLETVGDAMSASSRTFSHQLSGFPAESYDGRMHDFAQ